MEEEMYPWFFYFVNAPIQEIPYALLMLVHLLQKYFLKIVAFVSKTIIELSVLCYNQTMCEVDQ